ARRRDRRRLRRFGRRLGHARFARCLLAGAARRAAARERTRARRRADRRRTHAPRAGQLARHRSDGRAVYRFANTSAPRGLHAAAAGVLPGSPRALRPAQGPAIGLRSSEYANREDALSVRAEHHSCGGDKMKVNKWTMAACMLGGLVAFAANAQDEQEARMRAALAAPERSAENKARDEARKPIETIQYLGIKT